MLRNALGFSIGDQGLIEMTDNSNVVLGPADPKRIDIHANAEMRHWVREFGRSAIQLKEAVKAVGPLVSDVRAHLQKQSLYKLR
jgi:hypothetical protein